MSAKSFIDQAEDAAGNASVTSEEFTLLHAMHTCMIPDLSPACTGNKISQGAKSVTGATAGKVQPCIVLLCFEKAR